MNIDIGKSKSYIVFKTIPELVNDTYYCYKEIKYELGNKSVQRYYLKEYNTSKEVILEDIEGSIRYFTINDVIDFEDDFKDIVGCSVISFQYDEKSEYLDYELVPQNDNYEIVKVFDDEVSFENDDDMREDGYFFDEEMQEYYFEDNQSTGTYIKSNDTEFYQWLYYKEMVENYPIYIYVELEAKEDYTNNDKFIVYIGKNVVESSLEITNTN